eukprot:6172022-Amphidinium_carterae.1
MGCSTPGSKICRLSPSHKQKGCTAFTGTKYLFGGKSSTALTAASVTKGRRSSYRHRTQGADTSACQNHRANVHTCGVMCHKAHASEELRVQQGDPVHLQSTTSFSDTVQRRSG